MKPATERRAPTEGATLSAASDEEESGPGEPIHPTRRRSRLGMATQDLVARYWGAVLAALPVAGLIGGLLTKAFDRGLAEGTTATTMQRHTEQIAVLDRQYAAEAAVRAEADKQLQASVADLKGNSLAIQTELKYIGEDVKRIMQAVAQPRPGVAR